MRGLEAVVANRPSGGETDMNDRGPTLELVMTVSVEQIRNTDGGGGAGRFDGRESRVMIHDVVGEQNFLTAAAAHVESRKVIERAGGGDAGEQPIVGPVPESMRVVAGGPCL